MSATPKPSTPQEIMMALNEVLRTDPSRTEGVDATFAFDVEGAQGGHWWIEARDGLGAVHTGSVETPTVTIYLSDKVLVQIGNEEVTGEEAFMSGLLTVAGDQSKAMFLGQIFGQ